MTEDLTEAESALLWSAYVEDSITALREATETIVAAREAAARREALLEAEEKHRVEVERLTDAFTEAARVGHDNAKAYLTERRRITRVEALAERYEAMERDEGYGGELWSTTASAIRAALAEPERDEESGR